MMVSMEIWDNEVYRGGTYGSLGEKEWSRAELREFGK